MTALRSASSGVRVYPPHDVDVDYHQWVATTTRLKLDRAGRMNHRMTFNNATLWVCNNPDCYAQAIVSDEAIEGLIEAAEDA